MSTGLERDDPADIVMKIFINIRLSLFDQFSRKFLQVFT